MGRICRRINLDPESNPKEEMTNEELERTYDFGCECVEKNVIINHEERLTKKMNLDLDHPVKKPRDTKKNNNGSRD